MSPSAGRFLTRDPISYYGSPFDLYEFVEGQPTFQTDPSGEIIPLLVGVGVGIGIFLSPNIANAPRPIVPVYPNPGILGSEPQNAVIGGAVGDAVGCTIVGASACIRICVGTGSAGAAGAGAGPTILPNGTNLIGWVHNGQIVAIGLPNTSHAALGSSVGVVVNGTAVPDAHAFSIIKVGGTLTVMGS